MSLKENFLRASLLTKMALIIIIVSNLFNWIAFTTTSWYVPSGSGAVENEWGIWRTCSYDVSTPVGSCQPLHGVVSDWYGAVQAFAIFGFLGINTAMILIILFLFINKCNGNAELKMAAIVICFVTAVCYLISVVIFAAKMPSSGDFGYSFGLAIVAFILEVVPGVLLLLDGKCSGTSPA